MPKKWKVNTGAALVSAWPFIRAYVQTAYPEYVLIADGIGAAGASLMGVGIAHRAEKNGIAGQVK